MVLVELLTMDLKIFALWTVSAKLLSNCLEVDAVYGLLVRMPLE